MEERVKTPSSGRLSVLPWRWPVDSKRLCLGNAPLVMWVPSNNRGTISVRTAIAITQFRLHSAGLVMLSCHKDFDYSDMSPKQKQDENCWCEQQNCLRTTSCSSSLKFMAF
uniref:Uncharacterized protein n=1 Tax=Anguilla anguilla TaxID=7936 RepID=A0A0E9WIU9_ANGAN